MISLATSIVLRNVILILASLSFIANCYVDDLAIYKAKNILAPSLIYTILKIAITSLIVKFKIFVIVDEVTSLIFINAISDFVLLMIFKRVFWRIKLSKVFNIQLFDANWYKDELAGILNTLKKNNNSIISRVIKIFVTVSISRLPGYESIANFILTVQKTGVPFFAARDLNFKEKMNRIADTNGLDMKTSDDVNITRAIVL